VRVLLRCAGNVMLEDIEAVEYFTGLVEAYGGFNLLHTLDFQAAYDIPSAATTLNLITKCTSLHTLHLKVQAASVCIRDHHGELSQNKSLEAIVADLGLDAVLQCKALRHVRLAGCKSKPYEEPRLSFSAYMAIAAGTQPKFNDLAGLKKVGVWMKEKFAEKGQRVVVVMSRPCDEEEMEIDWYDELRMRDVEEVL
jgi:hypothetical protein